MAKQFDISSLNNLLVIVPHQDDEILMGAGLIYEMIKQDKKVNIAVVTNGDYECNDLSKGRARLKETLRGLETLGVSSENVYFLGYADTGMPREESFLMSLYGTQKGNMIFPSSASKVTYGLDEKQDYHYQCFGKHGDYSRNTLTGDLIHLLMEIQPDSILTTHCSDMHGDHEGLFYFVNEACEKINISYNPRIFVGLIHSPEGDDTWPLRDTETYSCPKGLEDKGLKWDERMILPLRKEMTGGLREGNLKYEALLKYETALEPNAVEYLMSFIKDEEIFWEML